MTRIFDHTNEENDPSTPEPSSSWDKVPVRTEDGETIWHVGDVPAIKTIAVEQVQARENVLEHCRQYPEQWEVLEPAPAEAMDALRYAHQALHTEHPKAIIVVVDEHLLLTEEGRRDKESHDYTEAVNMLTDIARLGRSHRVHLLLGMGA